MSDSTVHNLLAPGAVKGYRLVPDYAWPGFDSANDWTQRAACTPGKTYTLSIVTNVAGEVCFGFYLADGSVVRPYGYEEFHAGESVVRTLTAPAGAKYVAASWVDGNRRPMVVEGSTPAAWAPAEGETLTGVGGASMSANLWKAENVTPAGIPEDGIYACSGTRGVRTNVSLDKLAANQTFHCGFSVNPGKDDKFNMTLCYRDAAGSVNYAFGTDTSAPAGKWTRVSESVVIPSDMTVYQMVICNNRNASGASGWKVTNPTLSLGSPVCLASSAHTPYATQNHVMVTYATKASLKITDDSIKAEVSARAETDRNVADLSSRLSQTANSLTSEISDRRTAITNVTGLANAAQSTADAAKTSASSAVSTANSASASAANAVKTANSASTAASAASTAAGKASTDAAAAVKTANTASSTANSAATTANSAKSTANAASSTASAAKNTADGAANDATKAQTMATENKSSIKQLSNSITVEVTKRTQTDRMVSEVSSRLTQTAEGFSASINRLSETDKKVNSWFDFGADASGNPQLTMGSSTSPVVGVYTNTGLAYQSRSGATLMELDAASQSSTMPHVQADDVSIGRWKWVPTQNGTHLTLVWAG